MNTSELVKNNLCYGMTNRRGTWMYIEFAHGQYWFSKEFDILATPLTKADVEEIVYKK